MNGGFVQSWAHLGHNMLFSTWQCSSINKITFSELSQRALLVRISCYSHSTWKLTEGIFILEMFSKEKLVRFEYKAGLLTFSHGY